MAVSAQQPTAGEHQIGEGKQRKQLRRILGQALVTRLPMLEEILDDMEGVLHLGTNTRLGVFHLFDQPAKFRSRQLFALAGFHGDLLFDFAALALRTFFNALIAGVSKGHRFFAMQQRFGL